MGTRTWSDALTQISNSNAGIDFTCDDYTAGTETDWRLPSRFELESLLHLGVFDPAIPNTAGTGKWTEGDPFTGVQSGYYWSGTSYAFSTGYAWGVNLSDGYVVNVSKTFTGYVWPVRGGQ